MRFRDGKIDSTTVRIIYITEEGVELNLSSVSFKQPSFDCRKENIGLFHRDYRLHHSIRHQTSSGASSGSNRSTGDASVV